MQRARYVVELFLGESPLKYLSLSSDFFICFPTLLLLMFFFFQARKIALETMALLKNVTDTMSTLTVVGEEPVVVTSPHLSVVLQKVNSDIEVERTVSDGKVAVHFPNFTELLGEKLVGRDVDVQVRKY